MFSDLLIVRDTARNVNKTYKEKKYPFKLVAEYRMFNPVFLKISAKQNMRQVIVVSKTQKAMEKFIRLNTIETDDKLTYFLFTGPASKVIKKIER